MRQGVEAVLRSLRPLLALHNGDIELVSVNAKSKTVSVRFEGACSHCPISEVTLVHLVEKELRKVMPTLKKVIAVS